MTSRSADSASVTVRALLDDAWEQYRSAIERLNAGDVLDACGATGSASEAAVLANSGNTATTINIASGLRSLARQFDLPQLSAGYAERGQFLHIDACYCGACNNEDIPDLIYGTAEYIRAAEGLAQRDEESSNAS